VKRASGRGLYRDMRNKLLLVIAATLPLASPAHADPPQCGRWQIATALDTQLVTGNLAEPDYPLDPFKQETANNIRYSGSSYETCKKYVNTFYPGKKWKRWPIYANNVTDDSPGAVVLPHFQAYCVWDSQEPGERGYGVIDWDDSREIVSVNNNVQPDPHCYCTVNNPKYAGLVWDGALTPYEAQRVLQGNAFPKSLREDILAKNAVNGILHSDAPFEDFEPLQTDFPDHPDAAQIDHIIPRTDSKGCLCGGREPANAAVISRYINGQMSNKSPKTDPHRAQMYAQFVTCRDPSVAEYAGRMMASRFIPFDDIDMTESTLDLEIASSETVKRDAAELDGEVGGCSASHGASFLGLGLGLTVLGLRRRRR
jgi:hypothetical protein